MPKKATKAKTLDSGEVLEPDESENRGASNPIQPEGWHPERLRAPGSVKVSQLRAEQPNYEPRHSSDAYLDTAFGSPPGDLKNHIGQAMESALDTVKQSWREVDEAKGPILRNEMEAEAKRLDQLDRYADARRQAAETAVTDAVERIDQEIEASHELTAMELKPTPNETPLIATWQATLANKSAEELREIVRGAIQDNDTLVIKAALGAREWMLPMGATRKEMMRLYEEQIGSGRASYRDRLHSLRGRLETTRNSVKEHFDKVLTPRQKQDLKRARQRAAEAANV